MLPAAVVAAVLVGYNTVTNLRWPGDSLYVPRNLAVTAALGGVAAAAGLDRAALGMVVTAPAWRIGGAAVAAVAAAVAAVVALAPHVRAVRAVLSDHRAARPPAVLLREALVRIPFGTVVLEEFAFRGVLLGLLLPAGEVVAVAVSSVAFGLWHIGPTVVTLEDNEVRRWRGALVAGGVTVTAAGGVALAVLRLVSGSLLVPAVVHWAVNALGLLAAAVWQRTSDRSHR